MIITLRKTEKTLESFAIKYFINSYQPDFGWDRYIILQAPGASTGSFSIENIFISTQKVFNENEQNKQNEGLRENC